LALRSILAAVLVALVAAPAASASTTKVERGMLSYTAAPGEANDVNLSLAGGFYVIRDAGATSLDVSGRECHSFAGYVMCDAKRVKTVVVDLGDGHDAFTADAALDVQLTCASCAGPVEAPVAPVPPVVEEPPAVPSPDPTIGAETLVAGPPVTISSAPVAIDAHGRVPVEVSCPATAADGCAGRVTVALPAAPSALHSAKRAAAAAPVLGRSRKFKLAAGQTKVVPVRLDRRASRIIKRRGGGRRRVKLVVTVEVTTSSGTQAATSTITVMLRRARRH
jgi:hypothetical protein